MIVRNVSPQRQNINIAHERAQDLAYQAYRQPDIDANQDNQHMPELFREQQENPVVNNPVIQEIQIKQLDPDHSQELPTQRIWGAIYQHQQRVLYAEGLKQGNNKLFSSAISRSHKELHIIRPNRLGADTLHKPLERNVHAYYENNRDNISSQVSTEASSVGMAGNSDDPNGSDDPINLDQTDDFGDDPLIDGPLPNTNQRNQQTTIKEQSIQNKDDTDDPMQKDKYTDDTKITVATTLVNVAFKTWKLLEENKKAERETTCMDIMKVTGKQVGKGAAVLGAKYLENNNIGNSGLLQAGTILAKKAIDNNGLSKKDITEATLDFLRLQTQKRFNKVACENILKYSSKTTTNLASNSGISQSVITANTNTLADGALKTLSRSASNLAKANIVSGLISFAVGTAFDVLKGKDVKQSLKQNAKTSVGSTVGGFLGGLIGSCIPIVGTTVGGAVGSVIGSYFASWF